MKNMKENLIEFILYRFRINFLFREENRSTIYLAKKLNLTQESELPACLKDQAASFQDLFKVLKTSTRFLASLRITSNFSVI